LVDKVCGISSLGDGEYCPAHLRHLHLEVANGDPVSFLNREAGLQEVVRLTQNGGFTIDSRHFILEPFVFCNLAAQIDPSSPGENSKSKSEDDYRCQKFIGPNLLPQGNPFEESMRVAENQQAAQERDHPEKYEVPPGATLRIARDFRRGWDQAVHSESRMLRRQNTKLASPMA
jgi:hypothetical protein